ncbi:hypothetical protein Dform_00512 [Dehalogenimonas formicexedens]|uniref:Uncharacterized protein n=2 Tax=Dehalogenimonas formicexedens TaxID=1839801 RepID=A0A1P8F5V7_9CHLR|nr:hypothetical protein Dform_00512 [Dehalogenimonas formicexedens]
MNARFVFSSKDGEIDETDAQAFADALMVTLAVLYDLTLEEPPIPVRIHSEQITSDGILRTRNIDDYETNNLIRYHAAIGIPNIALYKALQIMPVFYKNQSIMNSASFYRESIHKIWLCEEDIAEIILDNEIPTSIVEKANIETAYQNAFKAIEAIIGEPPSNIDRLRDKMVAQGIDPDEVIGGSHLGSAEETIIKKVLRMQRTRDKKAAHGKTDHSRDIDYVELNDKQKLAKRIILHTVSHLSQ